MAYKRQIAYFDYIEDGQKKGSKGFCKWEQRNGCHVLFVSLSGLPGGITEKAGIYTKAGGVLGELNLQNGRADAVFRLKEDGHDWCRELGRIQIPLSQGRELAAEFPEGADPVDIKVLKLEPEIEWNQNKEELKMSELVETPVKVEAAEVINEPEEPELIVNSELMPEEQPLLSLWDCLAAAHEMMHPFGTEAEYYRIMMEDIYLLRERYHILRNNQFLLHGYYNYKYLILGKKDEESEEYWLGVPGIYHEREKMAARMYGFEKFEGAKPRYGIGDLGYYLITVE